VLDDNDLSPSRCLLCGRYQPHNSECDQSREADVPRLDRSTSLVPARWSASVANSGAVLPLRGFGDDCVKEKEVAHSSRASWIVVAFAALLALSPAGARSASDVPPAVREGISAGDWSGILAARDAAAHAVVASAAAAADYYYTARNPGQRWTTNFNGRGFSVVPDHGEWTWALDLASWGIEGAESRVPSSPLEVRVEGSRVEYAWSEALTEWFVNDSRGLEHGYTVHAPPREAAGGGPLVFRLTHRGPLRPRVADDGLGAAFLDASGVTALQYAGLLVHDADGQTVSARMVDDGVHLSLRVEAGSARYPLTIDPVVQQAYLKASNTNASDWFGFSVAISGDTVVVGALGEDSAATGVNGNQADNSKTASGAAYVFVRSGTGWSQQAYLKASNTDGSDWFGRSVAISGDTVVVGSQFEDSAATGVNGNQADNSASQAGAVYVFVRSGASWSQQAYLKASNTNSGDQFGASVTISGDTVVVGARFEASAATGVNGNQADNSASQAGAVYVFVRSGVIWSQQAYLKASNPNEQDYFGHPVAIFEDTVVVGAYGEDSAATGVNGDQASNSASGAGAAYVFVRSGAIWSQQAYLKASNTNAFDEFGWQVATVGDTVVVGASLEDSSATGVDGNQADNSAQDAGAAYVFVRNGGIWSQQAYLKASNTNAQDAFGVSLAISGDTVVVGAIREDSAATGVNGDQADNRALEAGAAYVFVRSGASWGQQAYLKASNTNTGDGFGDSVAIAVDSVVVGARLEASAATGVNGTQADNSAGNAGAAYVFDLDLPPDPWTDLVSGLAGISGIPNLVGTGTLALGSAGKLVLSNAAPSALSILFVSFASTPVPFVCGTFVPCPVATHLPLRTNGTGSSRLGWAAWPGGLSGSSLYFQYAIQDAAAVCGVALSNALRADVP
jgi:FG-GAP repeat